MRIIPLLTVMIFLTACAGSVIQTRGEASKNRDNMLELNIGQTKDQVLAIMGKPYKTEMYISEGKPTEFWLYLTEGKASGKALSDSNFTPFAFENGTLKGWGRNYYDKTLRVKKDITIEQK